MAEQKQFEPTEKRVRDARKEGNIQKSQVLTQAGGLLTLIAILPVVVRFAWVQNEMLLNCIGSFDTEPPAICLISFGKLVGVGIIGVLLVCAAVGITLEALQIGIQFEASLLVPKGTRLDPVRGLQRLGTGIWECWEVILKGIVLITISAWYLRGVAGEGFLLLSREGGQVAWSLDLLFGFLLRVGGAFIVFGGCDYLLKRKRYRRDLSMSLDEVRREHKEQEGDPLFRAVRKSMHEALLLQDLERRIRRSKVIVVERSDNGS